MARTLVGTVTSDKVDKTIVITVHTRKTHPLYKKQYSVTTKFMAHDEKNVAKLGDLVEVIECRPLSARKRFTLNKVLETAKVLHVEPEPEIHKPKKSEQEAIDEAVTEPKQKEPK